MTATKNLNGTLLTPRNRQMPLKFRTDVVSRAQPIQIEQRLNFQSTSQNFKFARRGPSNDNANVRLSFSVSEFKKKMVL